MSTANSRARAPVGISQPLPASAGSVLWMDLLVAGFAIMGAVLISFLR